MKNLIGLLAEDLIVQYINKKYIYEPACESDGEEISRLLEKTAFDGGISLVYAKRPNAFVSVNKDCEKSIIVVGRDIKTKEIKGVGICQIFKMLINGKPEQVAYLGGLRIDEDSALNIVEAYKIIEKFIKENNIKYTYTTILEDNIYTQKMLTKRRKVMPLYQKISDYTVNIFPPKIKYKSDFICRKATISDIEKLKQFINKKTEDIIFFPDINDLEDFYVLSDKDENILCCGKLWEQTDYKQLIIKKYSLKYRILKNLSNPILKLLNYPQFPNENEIIKYQTLSFVLYENEENLKDFIKQISHLIDYNFFVYGSTNNDIDFAPIKYKSFVYLVDWDKNIDINKYKNSKIYIECGLL